MSRPVLFKFRLYVAGDTQNSLQAVANLNALCRSYIPQRHEIEIVDVLREPRRALDDAIFMTPALIRLFPSPPRKIVGTLSQTDAVLEFLELKNSGRMKITDVSAPSAAPDEVTALIGTLLATERRLVDLTGGEVDAVTGSDGRTFLLQRAQEQLRGSEAGKQAAILNALPAHIALLDAQGTIVVVNDAWRHFASANALPAPGDAIGVNYLAVCDRAEANGAAEAPRAAVGIRAVLSGELQSFSLEYPCHSPAEERWFSMTVTPLANDGLKGAVVMHVNITERKRGEIALRESSEKFQQLADNITDAFWIRSPDMREVQYISPAFERIWGRSVASLYAYPQQWSDFILAEDRERVLQAFGALTHEKPALDIEYRILRPDGEIRWVRVRGFQIRDGRAQLVRHVGIVADITEAKHAAEALRASEAEFSVLSEAMPQIVWITRADGWNIHVNQQWINYTGLTAAESHGHAWTEAFHPDDRRPVWDAWQKAMATGAVLSVEGRLRRADGVYRWWLTRAVPNRDVKGTILKWFGTSTDVHDLKMAEIEISRTNHALEDKQTELRVLIDMMPAMIAFKDTDNVYRRVNERLALSLGKSVAEVEGKTTTELFPRDGARYDVDDAKVIQSGLPEMGTVKRILDINGHEAWQQTDKVPVRDDRGKVIGVVVMAQDITARKRADEALRASEKRFRALFDQAAVGVVHTDAGTGKFVQVNQRFCDIAGYSREELEGLGFADITHPQDIAAGVEISRRLNAGEIRDCAYEKRYIRKDGAEVSALVTVSAISTPGEKCDGFIAIVQDVTERKRLDEHFLQAQKMEALGQFSGGVAHDFNNILAAISGYAELSRMLLEDNPIIRGHLDAVIHSADRAVDLVRQILTFSRQEPQHRRPIQLQAVVAESIKLMRATIPTTIDFETSVSANAPIVLANANQIHQVMMNLGINAWHAMKDAPGRLQIKLAHYTVDAAQASTQPRLHPGSYARISISDTGKGMDAATLRRIFEPFFTTKPPGEGTGLGLAVVHGIMDGHDGAVAVYSTPGDGAIFHLYFPAHAGEIIEIANATETVPRGNGQRILVVDDEELLVKLGQQTLFALGYQVEIATQPAIALAMVMADPTQFDLVLTDQTMPGMTGIVLAGELQRLRPGLPIILMTGYSASLKPEHIKAAGIHQLLIKPTSIQSLGVAVHAALSGQPPKHNGSNSPYR